jgi:malonyl-CoA O-methyltransferase
MPDDVAFVRDGYDRWAVVYDHDVNPLPALEEPLVHAALGDVRDLDVLDLGCGTGRHTAWLAAAGARVTAVDFSPGMLAEAQRKTEDASVRFITHDLHEPLPLASATFDLVVSGLVLEHLRDLDAFFTEAHRVLRPGALAVLSAMHPAMFLRGAQARFTDPETGEKIEPGSLPHQIDDFVAAATRAGFVVEHLGEHGPDAAFAARYPRALRHVGHLTLVVMQMRAAADAQSAEEACRA